MFLCQLNHLLDIPHLFRNGRVRGRRGRGASAGLRLHVAIEQSLSLFGAAAAAATTAAAWGLVEADGGVPAGVWRRRCA